MLGACVCCACGPMSVRHVCATCTDPVCIGNVRAMCMRHVGAKHVCAVCMDPVCMGICVPCAWTLCAWECEGCVCEACVHGGHVCAVCMGHMSAMCVKHM